MNGPNRRALHRASLSRPDAQPVRPAVRVHIDTVVVHDAADISEGYADSLRNSIVSSLSRSDRHSADSTARVIADTIRRQIRRSRV
jgi:hypothetical protein